MPLSSTERQRRYREKLRAFDEDAYKEKMKLVEEQNREYNFFILFKEEIDNLNSSLSFLL